MNSIKRDWAKALISAGFDVPPNRAEFNISCPFHSDKVPSLSINIDKGKWICHAFPDDCGKGHIRSLLSKFLDISPIQAEKLAFDEIIKDEVDFFPSVVADEEITLEGNFSEVNFPFVTEVVPKWILDRGFKISSLVKWECGFDNRSGSLAIPILDNYSEKKIGWLKRQPEGLDPKYLYSSGLPKSKILFGLYNYQQSKDSYIIGDSICLTEGPLDTLWLDQNNFPSVALLGLFLSRTQEKLLSVIPVREIILCLDNDEAGHSATEHITKRLKKYFTISRIELPQEVKDVQDIKDKQILNDIIYNRTIF